MFGMNWITEWSSHISDNDENGDRYEEPVYGTVEADGIVRNNNEKECVTDVKW